MRTNEKGQVLIDLDVKTEMKYHCGFWCVPVSVLKEHKIIVIRHNKKQ